MIFCQVSKRRSRRPASQKGNGEPLKRGSHDLVLADAKLPDGSGMDVCDAAAALGIKCIVITGYAFTLPEGVGERYDVLLKPLRPAELVAAIERVLRS